MPNPSVLSDERSALKTLYLLLSLPLDPVRKMSALHRLNSHFLGSVVV